MSSAVTSPTYTLLPSSAFPHGFVVARYAFSRAESYLTGISTQFDKA